MIPEEHAKELRLKSLLGYAANVYDALDAERKKVRELEAEKEGGWDQFWAEAKIGNRLDAELTAERILSEERRVMLEWAASYAPRRADVARLIQPSTEDEAFDPRYV